MKHTKPTGKVALLSLVALMASATGVASAPVVEQHDFEPGQLLELDLSTGGSISIESWDQPGMEITYQDRQGGLDNFEILIRKTDNGLAIDSRMLRHQQNSSLHFDIKAPKVIELDFFTAGGSIDLRDVMGEFSGETGGGTLRLINITGKADLSTGGGQIEVRDSMLDGRVKTGGGKVSVENVIGDLRASSGGGAVIYKNVRTSAGDVLGPGRKPLAGATDNTVLISNAGGKINVTDAPEGAAVDTGGGNIRVSGAERFVSARTGGGDVDIEILEGWVDAWTGAGEIDVVVLENAVERGDIMLFTGNGDVSLTVPDDFSMDLNVELGVTNNSGGNFTVSSDFGISVENPDTWDYSHGSPRKFTYGSFTQYGGQHKVTIKTTNGDVVIKKGP